MSCLENITELIQTQNNQILFLISCLQQKSKLSTQTDMIKTQWDNNQQHNPLTFANQKVQQKMDHKEEQIKKAGKSQTRQIRKQKTTAGRWDTQQNKIYSKFLKDNFEQFQTEFKRRQNRVFYKLSLLLGGKRSPQQCKSHHQKMQLKQKYELQKYIKDKEKNSLVSAKSQKQMKQITHFVEEIKNQKLGFAIYTAKGRQSVLEISVDFDKLDAW